MSNLQEIIEELKEKKVENQEMFDSDGDVYRGGKADAFEETIEIIIASQRRW